MKRAAGHSPKVCISYRRADSMAITGRIFDRLVSHFGADAIFMDIDDIPFGVDFREHIDNTIRKSDVLVAVVGPAWLGPRSGAENRICEATDPVAIEIQTALERQVRIVPVLVDGTVMPDEAQLPGRLAAFANLNAVEISSGRDFTIHIDRLIRAVAVLTGEADAVPAGAGALAGLPTAETVQYGRVVSLALLAIAAVLAAHYLIVVKFDLDDIYLRASVFVIGAFFGGLAFAHLRRSLMLVLLGGLAVAVLSILGMLTVVGLIDGVSILPTDIAGWQETAEYLATIAIGVGLGGVAAKVASFRKSVGYWPIP